MKIYKYRSCDNLNHIQEILRDGEFYFADWRELNDPMEGYFKYYNADHSSDELRKIVQSKDNYGISCFSLTNDEILLWSHYANNHKGLCIEIDTDFERSEDVSLEVIKYQNTIPWVKRDDGRLRTGKEILSSKIYKWNYEQEIRAFCEGKHTKHKVGRITKIILGIRVDSSLKTLVNKFREDILVVEATLDFDLNKIKV